MQSSQSWQELTNRDRNLLVGIQQMGNYHQGANAGLQNNQNMMCATNSAMQAATYTAANSVLNQAK